jgi:hypothetical protein
MSISWWVNQLIKAHPTVVDEHAVGSTFTAFLRVGAIIVRAYPPEKEWEAADGAATQAVLY